jgi:ABC-type Fe3+/spermidine/putrescine transport system ATPase subunit
MTDCTKDNASAMLVVRGLRVSLGEFRLGPISLSLRRGDYLVLMGPSGCGKTTLLKAIAGLLPPEGGEIHIGGRQVDRLPSRRRGVGYVPQHSLLFPHMSVADNVGFGLRYASAPAARRQERFTRAVELAGVGGLLKRYPATLSGGEARRVALARALAVAPAVLLLDEPLSMLDAGARIELQETLRAIRQQAPMAAVHVTHQADEAQAVANCRASMNAGQIVIASPAGDIAATPPGRGLAPGDR